MVLDERYGPTNVTTWMSTAGRRGRGLSGADIRHGGGFVGRRPRHEREHRRFFAKNGMVACSPLTVWPRTMSGPAEPKTWRWSWTGPEPYPAFGGRPEQVFLSDIRPERPMSPPTCFSISSIRPTVTA